MITCRNHSVYRLLRFCCHLDQSVPILFRRTMITPPVPADTHIAMTPRNWANERLRTFMQFYEDFLGLTEVKDAQKKVIDAEKDFVISQQYRREHYGRVSAIESKLKEVRSELDRTARAEDKYLVLVTQEHRLVKEERGLQDELNQRELSERETFSRLSAAVREAHEKERGRAERTKYWSVIGSVIGAVIGILGTSLNNWLKMKDLQLLVAESASSSAAPVEHVASELSSLAKAQHIQLESFIADLKKLLGEQVAESSHSPVDHSESSNEILTAVKDHRSILLKEMQAVKDIMGARKGLEPGADGAIVYVKNDLEEALGLGLKKTEENMEWKMKINSIVTAAFLYTAFALSVPVIYYVFGHPK